MNRKELFWVVLSCIAIVVVAFASKAYPQDIVIACTNGEVVEVFPGQVCPVGWWPHHG